MEAVKKTREVTPSLAAAKEISVGAASSLSELDGIFILKEGQRTVLGAFLSGNICFTCDSLLASVLLSTTLAPHGAVTCS